MLESIGIELIRGNINDHIACIEKSGTEPLVIVHCATAYGRESESFSSVLDTNITYPVRLIEKAITCKFDAFISLDTCYELTYSYLKNYTLSKRQMAQWGERLSSEHPFTYINLRLQHPYGPGDRKGKFVTWLIDECRKANNTIELTDGVQRKDFVHVYDVANAINLLADKHNELETGFNEFECGTGNSVSIKDFCIEVHTAMNSTAELQFGRKPTRDGEIMNSCANINRLTTLGWSPTIKLQDGIGDLVSDIH